MPPLRDDQYISLSPTDSPADDAEIDSGAAALGRASQVECRQVGKGLTRLASNLAVSFWGRIGEFLMRSRTGSELSPDEKALWIQSGLAVSPLMGTCLQYSLDFCLAWALIGEWTSMVLFPVPKGPGLDMGMRVPSFSTARIVAWARAAFEQGALPSLLMMPGLAPVLSLPGDRMFQATEVTDGHQRPAIYACLWRSQGGYGKISCLDCT